MCAAAPTATPTSERAREKKAPRADQKAPREDRRLLLRYHEEGDDRARAELVERLMPLVRHIARRYQRGTEPLEDLVQVASLGLIKAIDRFDPDRPTAFSSYAVPTMVGELKRYFRDFSWAVHVPRGMQERTVAVQSTVSRLSEELGRSPSPAEVGEAVELTEEQVLEAFEAALAYDSLSLDAPRLGAEDPDAFGYGDTIGEEDGRYELVELGVSIAPGLRNLPEREREILRMRFKEDMTQSEIAARVGVSQMHVSRLIRRSLARLEEAADGEVRSQAEEARA
jgi:RNA polymerase sigma-B factor